MGFDFAKIRATFFDSEAVQKKVAKARRRVLSKCGAFVRRRAKSSIRKRKKQSPPGQAPSSHAGQLKQFLFFAYDASTDSVVVGPVPFTGAAKQSKGAPEALEHGGPVTRRNRKGETKHYLYRGNPFMKPALDAEMPKFVSQFRDLI